MLNHNFIKNDFLNAIGTVRTDLPLEMRSMDIFTVWAHQEGEKPEVDNLEDKINSVQSALDNWPNVFSAIKNFFNNEHERFGFKGTKKFHETSELILGSGTESSKKSPTGIISQFVKDFKSLASADEDISTKRLEQFWEAADQLHLILTDMRYTRQGENNFGEYFRKKYISDI